MTLTKDVTSIVLQYLMIPYVLFYMVTMHYVILLMLSYELSNVILYHPRLSLMASSRLSLQANVVREEVFFTSNQGLVTKVMVTGRMRRSRVSIGRIRLSHRDPK